MAYHQARKAKDAMDEAERRAIAEAEEAELAAIASADEMCKTRLNKRRDPVAA